MRVLGLVLAAGAGTRYGRPKGLVAGPDGVPWVAARAAALRAGGCEDVVVVVGAAGEQVSALVPSWARVCHVQDRARGLSASLRTGLGADAGARCQAACVALVDTPDLTPAEVARVLAAASGAGTGALVRAVHHGRPGHPVLLGRDHWPAASAGTGDVGARRLLSGPRAVHVECGDLATGQDVDAPGAGAAHLPSVP